MKKLLSGNEAIALGAYHAGVSVATAYPGTPSTEILANLSKMEGIYTEWSVNEKVALEVAMGAAYSGVRAMASMKHVGLNVAADPFFAASTTGVIGGLVVISCDDPGVHSSQGEQDNRYFAKFGKVPMLEPTDSQEAYELMEWAFQISEQFDTPLLFRSTTRISHCGGVVDVHKERTRKPAVPAFTRSPEKLVMVPSHARIRRYAMEKRLRDLRDYVEDFPMNEMLLRDRSLGVISSGVAYQYAREVFKDASFLKLVTTYPVPEQLIRRFAGEVEKLVVVEELEPFLEQEILCMGIPVKGKEYFSPIGEFSTETVEAGAVKAGLISHGSVQKTVDPPQLPLRPPLLCAGCPHVAASFALRRVGFRASEGPSEESDPNTTETQPKRTKLIVASDIGCYTLAVYPPLSALDTTACMGASIGHALGLEKAGVPNKAVAVLGDSTFMHSGITGLIDVIYNQGNVTVIILDNETTAMTGHQGHPGTGKLATGAQGRRVSLESLVRGLGVEDTHMLNAFDLKAIESTLKQCVEREGPSVMIVRGACVLNSRPKETTPFRVDVETCNGCLLCIRTGCPAISMKDEKPVIEPTICVGEACGVCSQICQRQAIRQEAI